jgi:hypothetical protein
MWNEQKTFLTSQLSPGESLLWSGQPKQGFIFRFADVYFLFMIGFGLLWATLVLRTGGFPQFVALFAIPNVLWGLYGISGRYFVDSKRRAKTYYGITNDRIIIVWGLFNKKLKSLPLRTLPEISLDEKANGTGTIYLRSGGIRLVVLEVFPAKGTNSLSLL